MLPPTLYQINVPKPKWYVIVTTAPRRDPTLQVCIDSIRDCGWDNPIVLAEPDSPQSDATTIVNPERLGVWRNWVKSVRLALESDADVILTVQDDTQFHPDSKDFAEAIMWPAEDCGFVSLYTPKHYSLRDDKLLRTLRRKDPHASQLRPPGVNRIFTRSLWGACALIWPRKVLEHIIQSPMIESWLGAIPRSRNPAVYENRRNNPHIIANSDTAIGKIMNTNKYSMWFVDPSPVAHIAEYSAIGHGGNKGRRNAHRIADHTLPLHHQVPVPQVIYQIP
jgi:hypothetical protein